MTITTSGRRPAATSEPVARPIPFTLVAPPSATRDEQLAAIIADAAALGRAGATTRGEVVAGLARLGWPVAHGIPR